MNTLIKITAIMLISAICRITFACNINVCGNDSLTAPVSISSSVNTICLGGSVNLSIAGGSLSSGAQWFWYQGNCGANFIGTGVSVDVYPQNNTNYFVRGEGSSYTTECASVSISVLDTSVLNQIYGYADTLCPGGPYLLLITSGTLGSNGDWYWYTNSCGGNLIGNGWYSFASPSVTTTYYIRAQDDCKTSDCLSTTITIADTSIAPDSIIIVNNNLNNGNSVEIAVSGGNLAAHAEWVWYSGSCGNHQGMLGSGASLIVSLADSSEYFVRAEGTCSTSVCAGKTIMNNNTINNSNVYYVPGEILASNDTICSGETVTLTISSVNPGNGTEYIWYSGTCGGNFLGTGTSLTVSPANDERYYMRATSVNDTTNCTDILVSVRSLPTQPSAISGNDHPVDGSFEVYKVMNDPEVNNYLWSAPSGWTGMGIAGNITFNVGNNSGTITVTSSNVCGTGEARTLAVFPLYSISGFVTYDNTVNTPMDSTIVYLVHNNTKVDSTETDINGYYKFDNLSNNSYNILASTGKRWDGVNATDAYLVKKYFSSGDGLSSSIKLHAADVNLSFNINTADATKIQRRFVGADTSFVRGSWIFAKPLGGDTLHVSVYNNDTVIVNGKNVDQNIVALCVGDVNGSHIPLQGKKEPSRIQVEDNGNVYLIADQDFEIPVRVAKGMKLNAISLLLNYPKDLVTITGIEGSMNENPENLSYSINGNQMRIGWYTSTNPAEINSNESILIIKGKTSGSFAKGDVVNFSLTNSSLNEMLDEAELPSEHVTLLVSSISSVLGSNNEAAINNVRSSDLEVYPNPAVDNIIVKFQLEKAATIRIAIYNQAGVPVKRIANQSTEGMNKEQVDISQLPSGIYFLQLLVNETDIHTKKLVVVK